MVAGGRSDIGGTTTEHLVQGSSSWVAGENILIQGSQAYGIKTITYQDQIYLLGIKH